MIDYKQIFVDTDYVHRSGTQEERKAAEYLMKRCTDLGVSAWIEEFGVPMADIEDAHVYVDGEEIPANGCFCCGSGEVEGELYYMPSTDPVSIAGAKDKIVLLDSNGIGHFPYQDLMKAGAKALIFSYGNVRYDNDDIDERDLRAAVVGDSRKVLCATINTKEAVKLVETGAHRVKIVIRQNEYDGTSQNVVAELPGKKDEWIVLSAHYDSVATSHGAYDNMSGCAGLLGVMEQFKAAGEQPNYGLRLVFCGSEERGLLGSKAYVRDHKEELEKIVLNINLDMIGSTMGKFIARVSAEDKLAHYISYMGAEVGFHVTTKQGVYSSDSTPFADSGVPALSFARITNGNVAHIHCRYDLMDIMSMEQLKKDIDFIGQFTRRMANAAVCPVSREIPEKVKKELDEYLFRKRKE